MNRAARTREAQIRVRAPISVSLQSDSLGGEMMRWAASSLAVVALVAAYKGMPFIYALLSRVLP